jgi:hydroxyacylglutathione hydrolase
MRVHRLPLHGANAYVISGEHHVLVDTGPARARTALLEGLAQIGLGGQDLSLVLVTHAHATSVGNAAYLQRVFHVPVAVQGADAPILASGLDRTSRRSGIMPALRRSLDETRFEALAPDVVFGHTLSLEPFGCQGTVVHTPGHTIGSTSVLLASGDAIVGDLVTGGWFGGRVMPNRPTRHVLAEIPGRVARSLALLNRLGAQRLHPGTGGELLMADVKRLIIDRSTAIAVGPNPTRVRERRLRTDLSMSLVG